MEDVHGGRGVKSGYGVKEGEWVKSAGVSTIHSPKSKFLSLSLSNAGLVPCYYPFDKLMQRESQKCGCNKINLSPSVSLLAAAYLML